jgi:hypothetical protein
VNESSNRIACAKCGAANFPSSSNCWQCGEALSADQVPEARAEGEFAASTPEPPPGAPPSVEPVPAVPPPPEPAPSSPVYVPPTNRRDTETLVIVGFVLAGLGLIGCCCCCSPLFSVAAIVLGAIAYSKGDNRGIWVIVAGAVALLSGGVSLIWAPWGRHGGPWNGPFPRGFPGPWRNI